jgi:hypothetical protein
VKSFSRLQLLEALVAAEEMLFERLLFLRRKLSPNVALDDLFLLDLRVHHIQVTLRTGVYQEFRRAATRKRP